MLSFISFTGTTKLYFIIFLEINRFFAEIWNKFTQLNISIIQLKKHILEYISLNQLFFNAEHSERDVPPWRDGNRMGPGLALGLKPIYFMPLLW